MSFLHDPTARALLAQANGETDLVTLNSRLRKAGHAPDLVAWVLLQLELRGRAAIKLGEKAASLFFTRSGLEQASRWPVAQYHASRLAGYASVTDLGCGLAIDSLAFSEAGLEVVALEQDPETAEIASENLSHFPKSRVLNTAAEMHRVETEAVWFDPARRDLGANFDRRRMLAAGDFSPSLDLVFKTLGEMPGGAKLAPAIAHDLLPENLETTWVSHRRELVETSVWNVSNDRRGKRFAVMLQAEKLLEFSGEIFPAQVSALAQYVFEPDPAIIRSGLLGAFAKQHQLGVLSADIAYMTGETNLESPWLRSFQVLESLPLDKRQIRQYLAQKQIGTLEIKKRGVDIDPESFRRELKLKGKGAATLILTRVGDARRALVCAAS